MGLHWRWLRRILLTLHFATDPSACVLSWAASRLSGEQMLLALALLTAYECALGCSSFEVEWAGLNLHERNSSEHSWRGHRTVWVSSAAPVITQLTEFSLLSCLSCVNEGWEVQKEKMVKKRDEMFQAFACIIRLHLLRAWFLGLQLHGS